MLSVLTSYFLLLTSHFALQVAGFFSNRLEAPMEFELKTLSPEAVPRALAKAERYRLLNEPGEAESICLDALEIEPENQDALATLLLAQTDQFGHEGSTVAEAWKTVER